MEVESLHLTNEEERVLEGERGQGAQTAMELLVAIGEAFDAERMIPVTRAHAASSGQEGDLYFVEMLAKGGASCRIPTTTNPIADFEYFQKVINIADDQEEASVAWKTKSYYRQIGAIMSQSCIPYLAENIPEYGEHVAFSESSATPYVNSVIGALTNRESIQTALAAGVVGVTPEYGLHLNENRRGTVLVRVEANVKNGYGFSLLGQYVGKKIGCGIPVFIGIPRRPTIDQYINLCAMMNVTGAVPMFHIAGFTVEAKTVEEAFGRNVPEEKIIVTDHELQQTHMDLQTATGNVDAVILGCPHYNLDQMAQLAKLLRGKKVRAGVSFWVNTSATTKLLAERADYVRIIEESGARVVVDTCIDMFCWNNLRGRTGMTDSPKCAYYKRFGPVKVGSLEECVAASVEQG
jgi:predicted aconitase